MCTILKMIFGILYHLSYVFGFHDYVISAHPMNLKKYFNKKIAQDFLGNSLILFLEESLMTISYSYDLTINMKLPPVG